MIIITGIINISYGKPTLKYLSIRHEQIFNTKFCLLDVRLFGNKMIDSFILRSLSKEINKNNIDKISCNNYAMISDIIHAHNISKISHLICLSSMIIDVIPRCINTYSITNSNLIIFSDKISTTISNLCHKLYANFKSITLNTRDNAQHIQNDFLDNYGISLLTNEFSNKVLSNNLLIAFSKPNIEYLYRVSPKCIINLSGEQIKFSCPVVYGIEITQDIPYIGIEVDKHDIFATVLTNSPTFSKNLTIKALIYE